MLAGRCVDVRDRARVWREEREMERGVVGKEGERRHINAEGRKRLKNKIIYLAIGVLFLPPQ